MKLLFYFKVQYLGDKNKQNIFFNVMFVNKNRYHKDKFNDSWNKCMFHIVLLLIFPQCPLINLFILSLEAVLTFWQKAQTIVCAFFIFWMFSKELLELGEKASIFLGKGGEELGFIPASPFK